MPEYGEKPLRKASDFQEALEQHGKQALSRELGLPDVDEILKELQRKHGPDRLLSQAGRAA